MDKKKVNDRVIIAINILLKRRPDLSKATLSELLGVTNTSFSHIMSKRMHASVEMMASLCLRFNISADWLLTGRGSMISETEGDTSLGQISMVLELMNTIKQQAEEIGQLKERISQLESEEVTQCDSAPVRIRWRGKEYLHIERRRYQSPTKKNIKVREE